MPGSPPEATREACPTPLAWQQVLADFRAQRRDAPFNLGRERHVAWTFGCGRPVYFLNPAGGSPEQFALTAWLMREAYECVHLDHVPLRWRDRADVGLRKLAAAVCAAADSRRHERFSVVAAGFGGLVALELLSSHPERVESAVLVCGFAGRALTLVERGLLAWGRAAPGPMHSLPGWRAVLQQNHRGWFPPFDLSRWQFLVDNYGATPIRQQCRRLSLAGQIDLRPSLATIRQPVLLVRTEGEGPVSTACQEELAQGLALAQTEWLHTTGLLPYLTHPHRMAKLMRTFLET
jgi:pimeloyl-ACP methyl ester carboxylesterase